MTFIAIALCALAFYVGRRFERFQIRRIGNRKLLADLLDQAEEEQR